ncbi:hypothetical protein HDU92_006517 [Lobulomyces angularis]|nr:hypothetical protein HDU92_006517 [Lobulomyces angularis]
MAKELSDRGSRSTNNYQNVVETEEKYIVSIDIPGISSSDLKIIVQDDLKVVKISGKTILPSQCERCLDTEIKLPKNIDLVSLSANVSDGILNLEGKKINFGRTITVNIQK